MGCGALGVRAVMRCDAQRLNQEKRGDCEWAPPSAIRSLLRVLKNNDLSGAPS